MNLQDDLAKRINPEKNRNFSAYEFGQRLKQLESFGEYRWPRKNGLRLSVVGTNGKGSVSHYTSEILRRAGFSVGLYTSPHLNHFYERIRINGIQADDSLEGDYQSLKSAFLKSSEHKAMWPELSYFELLTLLAIERFQGRGLDVQIYEAGLGGRLDATRLCNPETVLVTKIALDHTALLGHTRQAIFKEKLGIARESTRLVLLMEGKYQKLATDLLRNGTEILNFSEDERWNEKHNQRKYSPERHQPQERSYRAREQRAGQQEERSVEGVEDRATLNQSSPAGYLEQNFLFARWVVQNLEQQELLPKEPGQGWRPASGATNLSFQDLPYPPGRMFRTEKYGLTWRYDSGHNPASLHTVLSSLNDPTLLVLGLLPDRSYRQFLRVARNHGIQDVLCIRRPGLAEPPGILSQKAVPSHRQESTEGISTDETTAGSNANPGEASAFRTKRQLHIHAASGENPAQLREQIFELCQAHHYSQALFTGSYRIYDLFLEILGPGPVNA